MAELYSRRASQHEYRAAGSETQELIRHSFGIGRPRRSTRSLSFAPRRHGEPKATPRAKWRRIEQPTPQRRGVERSVRATRASGPVVTPCPPDSRSRVEPRGAARVLRRRRDFAGRAGGRESGWRRRTRPIDVGRTPSSAAGPRPAFARRELIPRKTPPGHPIGGARKPAGPGSGRFGGPVPRQRESDHGPQERETAIANPAAATWPPPWHRGTARL